MVNTYLAASPSSKSCQSLLDLIALPNLPFATYPTRLAWTEAAILYGWALTEAKTGLRTFASALHFAPFGDDSSTKPNSNYQTIVAGLTFDLSELTTTVPDVSWASKASASSEQVALVSGASSTTLNRMAAYAVAGSRGRTTALQHRWQELGLADADLGSFKVAVQEAEVLLPFEASASLPTGETIMGLAQGLGNGSSFPLGLGCMAGLSADLVGRVNEVENGVFGLAAVAEGGQFNASACLVNSDAQFPLFVC